MNKVVPIIGFVILSVMTFWIFGGASYKAWTLQPWGGVVMTFILLGLLFKVVRESQELSKVRLDGVFTRKNFFIFISVFAGALISYTLSVDIGLGAVVAAGLVAIIAALTTAEHLSGWPPRSCSTTDNCT